MTGPIFWAAVFNCHFLLGHAQKHNKGKRSSGMVTTGTGHNGLMLVSPGLLASSLYHICQNRMNQICGVLRIRKVCFYEDQVISSTQHSLESLLLLCFLEFRNFLSQSLFYFLRATIIGSIISLPIMLRTVQLVCILNARKRTYGLSQ